MKALRNFRGRRTAAIAGVAVFIALVWHAGAMVLNGNFHEILPGELYRSAQLTPAQLAACSQRYGIRTVLNLRGENSGSAWYKAELAETRQLGITHIDFSMSASSGLTLAQAQQLVSILKQARKPLLIHCQSGADRTGLAAALYLADLKGFDEEAAEEQISIWYGHISLPGMAAYAIDRSWEAMEPWLKASHS
jgi:protein tyrosine/serine phosphatase